MNKRTKVILGTVLTSAILLGACKPYDKPEFVTIKPNQTAFVIPLEGKTSEQSQFESESYLSDMQVATKRIEVPHKWVKTGRMSGSGEYMDTVKVIVVDRYPETREWANKKAFIGESKDSVKFEQGISATAQIEEADAAKFLYKYSGKTLEEVMDKEIKNKVGSVLLERYSSMTIEEIRANKKSVISYVEKAVLPYFKERGITLSNIGFIGDMKYTDSKIQEAINKKFNAEENAKAQAIESVADVKKAKAEAEANTIRSKSMKEIQEMRELTLKEKELDNQAKLIEQWDGKLPQVEGSDSIINLPNLK